MDPLENTTTTGLGERIRLLRGKRGLKQQDLASSEISASYISLIESGKRRPRTRCSPLSRSASAAPPSTCARPGRP